MTRRKVLPTVGVAVLLITAAAAFVFWRFPRQSTASPVLTLLVNRAPQTTVWRGAPLVFDVFLSATKGGRAIRVGSGSRPWHRLISFEQAEGGEALAWPVVHMAERSTRYGRDDTGRPTATQNSGAVADLEGVSYVHALTLGVAPEAAALVAAGTYRVRAIVDAPFWPPWRWRGRVRSTPVTITVQEPGVAPAGGSSGDLQVLRLRDSAAFYVQVKRFADAQRAATELLKLQPRSAEAYILLGEALEGLGQDREALRAYEYALSLVPETYEEPRYLMDRMSKLARKTGTMF